MSRKRDEKAVVNAIVDEELDLQDFVKQINEEGVTSGEQVMAMINRLLGASHHGSLSKQLLRQAWQAVFVAHFVKLVHKAEKHADRHIAAQVKAIRDFGRPITEIAAVVDEDVKERVVEKAIG